MTPKEKHLFNFLKKRIVSVYSKNNIAPNKIEDWKGEDIVSFQEDLFQKVKTKVSEKWFYTYFKNDIEKLPRIDMLNILSKYVGYKNWIDFKDQNSKKRNQNLLVFIVIFVGFLISFFSLKTTNKFHFCFIDEDKNEPIVTSLNIEVLTVEESPLFLKTDSLGCFSYKTKEDVIQFVVSSNYYKTDTIVRHLKNNSNSIKLSVDDYALMLDYYTNNKVKKWNQRKEELEKLIDSKAVIYQLYSNNIGVEIYTKKEFINLLTIPTNSLKRIQILNKEFKNGKIIKLKFIVK